MCGQGEPAASIPRSVSAPRLRSRLRPPPPGIAGLLPPAAARDVPAGHSGGCLPSRLLWMKDTGGFIFRCSVPPSPTKEA